MSLPDDELIDAENWVDLRVGETGTMIAKLDRVGTTQGIPDHIVVTFPNWAEIVLDVDARPERAMYGRTCHFRVRRTEDGLKALAVWQPGCPPIPLELPDTPSPAL